ncbi:C45 family autoproteolytic acyltransferase/hydrolase [Muricauda sp. 2012CJ35-5]|uniref:C45 family autoproteolytic acyltransferase/hydrolase n=1 Tax=Flagellimonas spongiicola TaxID=2942208 RepID=A0ABT0PQT6_9FLAO|nr:C45 family peptidase [Allomuricauda spongiicola]MCL6273762.1 C45 family autoproteolytic acyltransferase/hydrolase [Allomuricauda spongiicola]
MSLVYLRKLAQLGFRKCRKLILMGMFFSAGCFAQESNRVLKQINLSGTGYKLGLQHGTQLKEEIGALVIAWKKNTSDQLGKDADQVVAEFFDYANFTNSIKQWTPELYEEIIGIADGADQNFRDVFVLNLLDEFWVYVNNIHNHHCSGMGVPAIDGNPGYLSQNMDLENYTDGFQLLMRLERSKKRPEQLILTQPGLIALNGLNEKGIGVCVNTLIQLKSNATGLPVAFVIRRIINSKTKIEALDFIKKVNHASGQNYIVGIKDEVFDFEASANKVERFIPENSNGAVYHTNHPLVNNDLKAWFEAYSPELPQGVKSLNTDSHYRFRALEKRMKVKKEITDHSLIAALRSRDHKNNPVCKTNVKNGQGFTFASVVMTLSEPPTLQIVSGPPDESEFMTIQFTENEN